MLNMTDSVSSHQLSVSYMKYKEKNSLQLIFYECSIDDSFGTCICLFSVAIAKYLGQVNL